MNLLLVGKLGSSFVAVFVITEGRTDLGVGVSLVVLQ